MPQRKWTRADVKKRALSVMIERKGRMGSKDPLVLDIYECPLSFDGKRMYLPKDSGDLFQRVFGTTKYMEKDLRPFCKEISNAEYRAINNLVDSKRWTDVVRLLHKL